MYARTFAERFHQQFPQVELQYQLVSWDKGPLKMDRGEVNLVVADITSLNPAKYSLIPLVQREIKMICSVLHPLAKRKHMEISQVFEQKLAVCGAPPWARKWIQEHYPDSSYWDAPANLISNDYKLIGQLLHSSSYCTLIAEEVFFKEIQSGEFVARRLPEAPMTHAGIVVPTGSRPGPEILEAIDIIRQIDQDVPQASPAAPKRSLALN
jgi:DNA-binding transcriptional LysR family regulator